MSLTIPFKNQRVTLAAPPTAKPEGFGISYASPELDREELIDVIKKLASLHENGTLDEEEFRGVLKLTIGQYVEEELERRLSSTLEYKFINNRFINFIL